MAAPLGPDTGNRDQRPARRRGAVAAAGSEDPGRRRRLAALLLLGVLVIAGAIAGIVAAVTGSHHSTSAAGSASAQATGSSSASAQSSPAGTAGTLPAFGLVGGGGITPRAAAGNLAVTGSMGDVLFAEDGTALDQSAQRVISTAAQVIRSKHAGTVTVIGYTDAIGNASANQQLSLERAQAVITALRTDVGGTAVTYHAEARGQSKPVAANSTPSGRQLNRRVVITTP